ncbi:chitobiase/beta-hexosaminidase C-terminal domain-containing protein [Bacillus sp. ISL-75]|uniref:chitobiase/beta-hexosaminidase C-terminal domain-containing protein n=1 Tax=Bacillus sp. ISL-75 TaxID=2819137 RepID=UPI001BE5932F|nr:chitobiase/beta-hexosaminidase C-terminal domain-containing protein [Bacillus sp. ISL-75]MBT2728384.1 chitobiase/beta-hexosaminidase C-terminal domain-containing protein [Bacillus sp. ISL-75]
MTTGILPLETLKFQISLNTGFFECSAYTEDEQMFVTSGNHDTAGMSGGNLQYNFGAANRLTELFQYMINNYESICINAFGANTTQYDTWKTACMSAVQQDRLNFGANITDPNNSHAIIQPYKDAIGNILISPECKAKYYSMRDAYYFPPPYSIFRQLSCKSRLALASLFDCYINKGRYYPINLLQADFEAIDANNALTEDQKEAQKIYQINERANSEENGVSDASTPVFAPRRNAMRDQGGDYYGLTYDPDVQFDMDQQTAIQEKSDALNIDLGSIKVNDMFLGTTKIKSIYLGATLIGAEATPYTATTAPITQFRTNGGSYAGIGAATAITLTSGQPLWIDCQERTDGQEPYVACKTYYTTDGSTPTAASAVYTGALSFTSNTTLKVVTISNYGVAEAVKTLTITIAVAPTTTISPSTTVQNTIPFTVTLSTSEGGAAIKYKLGTSGTIYDYTGPFTVNQNSAGVASTNITVKYWAVGATATEAEKTITYDTAGAIPAKPVVTATAGNNQVALSWAATANTTSYTVYRSTALGTLGTALSQYQTGTTYTDTTAVNGTTYYYTVQAGNYGRATNSDQMTATPAAPVTPSYRYLKILGYGAAESGQEVTTRTVELEAYVGTTNVALNKTIVSGEAASTGGAALTTIVNGNKTTVTSGSYPIWWTATPNGNVVIDLGSSQALTKLSYYGYSVSGTQRTNRFKILGSNTNNGTDWVTLWDMSANTTVQPILPSGYDKVL